MKFIFLFIFCLIVLYISYENKNNNIKINDYFIDNSYFNFLGLGDISSLILVKVNDSYINNIDNINNINKKEFDKYVENISRLSKNVKEYAYLSYKTKRFQFFDPNSQITVTQIDFLIDEIKKGKVRTLIFDWDRTLTKFVDIEDERYFFKGNFSIRDVCVFYFGDCLTHFGRLWEESLKNRIKIYILSTNPKFNRIKHRLFIFELLRESGLDLSKNENNLIYIPENEKMGKQKKVRELLGL